jgi:hypothetical protein
MNPAQRNEKLTSIEHLLEVSVHLVDIQLPNKTPQGRGRPEGATNKPKTAPSAPTVATTKAKSTSSTTNKPKSTTRDPSAFEYVEKKRKRDAKVAAKIKRKQEREEKFKKKDKEEKNKEEKEETLKKRKLPHQAVLYPSEKPLQDPIHFQNLPKRRSARSKLPAASQ